MRPDVGSHLLIAPFRPWLFRPRRVAPMSHWTSIAEFGQMQSKSSHNSGRTIPHVAINFVAGSGKKRSSCDGFGKRPDKSCCFSPDAEKFAAALVCMSVPWEVS